MSWGCFSALLNTDLYTRDSEEDRFTAGGIVCDWSWPGEAKDVGRLLLREFRLAACGNVIIDERSAHWKCKLGPLSKWKEPADTEVLTEWWNRDLKVREMQLEIKSDWFESWMNWKNEDRESDFTYFASLKNC